MRTITIPLTEVLSVIDCAADYGFADDVLMSALFEWIGGWFTDEEVIEYADWFVSDDARGLGYSEEDRESALGRLFEMRSKYGSVGV